MGRVAIALVLALSLVLVMAMPAAAVTGTLVITEAFVKDGGTIEITVTDADLNTNAGTVQIIYARVVSGTEGLIAVTGEEVTGSAATYRTALPVDPGDDNLITTADIIWTPVDGDDSATSFDSVSVETDGTITLTFNGAHDGDLIYDTIAYASAEIVELTETGLDDGVFRGTTTISSADVVGSLQVVDGGIITASYYDADVSNRTSGADTVEADFSAPVIASATTTSTTTIDVVLTDTDGSGFAVSSIADVDFTVTGPTVAVASIVITGNDFDTSVTVALTTAAFNSGDTPTVAISGSIDDMVLNTVMSGAVVATDGVDPSLLSWDLDLDAKTATLTFDETVDASTLTVSGLQIQDTGSTGGNEYDLTNSTTSSANGTAIVITLSAADFNAITAAALATSIADSWLSMTTAAIKDMAGNSVTAIAIGSAVNAVSYNADATSPSLSSWALDLDAKTVTLTFDETVDASSLLVTVVRIQDAATLGTSSNLTDSSTSSANGTVIVIDLSPTDFDALVADTSLATSLADSYLTIGATAIDDMAANDVTAIADGSGVQATSYVAATTSTSPNLASWVLDMDAQTATLTFDETVDATTLDVTAVTIQDAATTATTSYTLMDSATTSPDGTAIVITLSATDFNAIAADEGLAVSTATSWITITVDAIDDMTGNDVNAIADGSGLNAVGYTADTTSPTLSSWDLDMDAQTVSLTFDEPVDASTLTATAVTIQDAASPSNTRTLTGGTTSSANGTVIVIDLSTADFDAIAADTSLATSIDDSYLEMTSSTISDMAPTPNAVTAITAGVKADSYNADATSPTIISVETVDGGDGKVDGLLITFSEAIVSATLEDGDFSIASANGLSGVYAVAITDGSADDEVITLDITVDGYDTDATPTVTYTASAGDAGSIKDIVGNTMVTATSSAATDAAIPVIIDREAQLGSAKVTVTFSEGVYAANDGTGALEDTDFTYVDSLSSGAGTLSSVSHVAGGDIAVLTLNVQTIAADTDTSGTPDTIAAAGTAISDLVGLAAATTAVDMLDTRNALSLVDGWNLVSIPKVADASWDIATSNATGTFLSILTYDNGSWSPVTDADSLDAVFINASGPQELTLSWTTSEQAVPPTKALEAGWNLLGANMDPDVESSVQANLFLDSASSSYSTLFSPGYNLTNWTVTTGTSDTESVLPYEGYWIYMEAVDTLAGRTS